MPGVIEPLKHIILEWLFSFKHVFFLQLITMRIMLTYAILSIGLGV